MFKILIVTNGWGIKTIAGGEYHILRVLERWNKEHAVSIVIPKSAYLFSNKILSAKYQIYFSSYEKEVGSHTKELMSYLVRILRSSFFRVEPKPDIIIASSHLLYDVLPASILRKRLKSKLVVYVHHILRPFRSYKQGIWSNMNLINEKISLFLCKRADLIFVVNTDIKDTLVAKGFPADKIVLTGNGVEHDFIESVKVDEKRFDGCFCGGIDAKKGVYDLVDVWEKVLKSFPNSRLEIIGDGPAYHDLIKTTKNKGLDNNIIFTGFLFGERKISAIKSSKIFISPSYEEGWGIAVSEAMACGLPIICYNLSAYKVFGEDIIKVDVGNKEEMAKAIIDLLANKDKQEVLAAKTKKVVNNILTWDNLSTEQLKEITKLLA